MAATLPSAVVSSPERDFVSAHLDDLHTDLHECLGHGSGRLLPGTDPDSNMSIAAGNPPPVEIRGRTLDGALRAVVRGFRYESPGAATRLADAILTRL